MDPSKVVVGNLKTTGLDTAENENPISQQPLQGNNPLRDDNPSRGSGNPKTTGLDTEVNGNPTSQQPLQGMNRSRDDNPSHNLRQQPAMSLETNDHSSDSDYVAQEAYGESGSSVSEPIPSPHEVATPGSASRRVSTRVGKGLRDKPPIQYFEKRKAEPKDKKPKKTRRPVSLRDTKDEGPFVPIHDYYHSQTFLKFKHSEWENDVDSEDDVERDSWQREVDNAKLHDFDDIPDPEKTFMVLWNEFMRSDSLNVSIKSIPQKCLTFIEKHALDIRDAGLEDQLPLHLSNLWDESLISRDHFLACLEHYHNLAENS